jgi:hypothetical protein
MDCIGENNRTACACTYESCNKRGKCCECVSYHRNKKQVPGCFFTKEGEKTYDRSFQFFQKIESPAKNHQKFANSVLP